MGNAVIEIEIAVITKRKLRCIGNVTAPHDRIGPRAEIRRKTERLRCRYHVAAPWIAQFQFCYPKIGFQINQLIVIRVPIVTHGARIELGTGCQLLLHRLTTIPCEAGCQQIASLATETRIS
ncbi:hypothetical protein D3C87_1865070 [compost metagenome]